MNEENINYISGGTRRVPGTLPSAQVKNESNIRAEVRHRLESKRQSKDDGLPPLQVTICRVPSLFVGRRCCCNRLQRECR